MMECQEFEHLVSDYLDGCAGPSVVEAFMVHYLACEPCRQLFDEVRMTVELCHRVEAAEPSPDLEHRILEATAGRGVMRCSTFDELLADYFDGFLPAEQYHLFESHFQGCPRCRRLLQSVEAARDLCCRLEPVAVPEGLTERIMNATTRADRHMPKILRTLVWLKRGFRRTVEPLLIPELVTASILFLATLGFLLVDLSEDRSLKGIYRGATERAVQMVNPSDPAGERSRLMHHIQKLRADVNGWIEAGRGLFTREPETPSPGEKQ
jgi:hypothetical protein